MPKLIELRMHLDALVGVGTALVVGAVLAWIVVGPGSERKSIHHTVLNELERSGDTVVFELQHSKYPLPCADELMPSRGVAYYRLETPDSKPPWKSESYGDAEITVRENGCELTGFAYRDGEGKLVPPAQNP